MSNCDAIYCERANYIVSIPQLRVECTRNQIIFLGSNQFEIKGEKCTYSLVACQPIIAYSFELSCLQIPNAQSFQSLHLNPQNPVSELIDSA